MALSIHAAMMVSFIDWISDTRSQGCTDLQSSVKCLNYRGIVLVLDAVYAVNDSFDKPKIDCRVLSCPRANLRITRMPYL